MTRTIHWTDNVEPLRRLTPLEPRAYLEVTDDLPQEPAELPRLGLAFVLVAGAVSWLSVLAISEAVLSFLKWLVW